MLTARCKKCGFSSPTCGLTCDYIGIMNRKRPCPPGDECTVFDPKDQRRQRAIPSISGKNGRRRIPDPEDLQEYTAAIDYALAVIENY